MAITIISPANSFVQFNQSEQSPICIWGNINFCLPVYDVHDHYFQFVIQGTEDEIDSLCNQYADEITVALVRNCEDAPLLTFAQKPERFRLSDTQVLYNWKYGFPGFTSVVEVGQCFKVQVTILATPYGYPDEELVWCSNCFERIGSDCYTSVVEYGNDEDGFGFKYCYGGDIEGGGSVGDTEQDCDPTVYTFTAVGTLSIPYTTFLKNKYGDVPTVQVWVYDGSGQLVNMGITAKFNTYPPTMMDFDFGGTASGIIVVR